MLLNYIKLSLRLLVRNPFFAILNIGGLSVGFAVFFVLWQYSSTELKSDRQWKDWQRIARVGLLWQWSDKGDSWESERYGVIGGELGPYLSNDFPEIDSYTRILYQADFNEEAAGLAPDIVMSYQRPDESNVTFRQHGITMADSNFLTFFTIPLIAGTPSKALTNSNALVMSASIARKYFGSENPLGRIVTLNAQAFMVTGVFQDLPTNTHLNFDILLSNTSGQINNWMALTQRPIITTYIKAKSSPDWKAFESKINDPIVIDRYFSEALKFFLNTKINLLIQPLPEVRFGQMWLGDQFAPRSKRLLYIFQTIGMVVLVLAIVNYISLNASNISQRLKEMGARKVSGAGVKDFALQFLIESALIFALSVALAFTIIQGLRTVLQEMVQIPLTTPRPETILFFTSIIVVSVGITAGYPAYLSATNQPQSLFRKKLTKGEGKFASLTTLEFSAAIVLIIWGFIIYNQISFVIAKDLGFRKSDVVVIAPPTIRSSNFESDMQTFTQTISSIPQIDQITRCHSVMGDAVAAFLVRRPGLNVPVGLDTNGGVDDTFIPFYDIPLLAGRNFLSSDRGSEIILSDGALSRLGFIEIPCAIPKTGSMLLNSIKHSLRLMTRNPFSTLINIAGLSIGFATFYILYPYAQAELGSDQFHTDYRQIARLSRYGSEGGEPEIFLAPHIGGIAKQFLNDYEEITDLTRFVPQEGFETFRQGFDEDVFVTIVSEKNTKEFFRETKIVYGDPNFFTFFSFPVVEGDPAIFLSAPNTVVLSESQAQKYFGETNPINKEIYLNDTIPLTITGIFKDLPRNTHIIFDMLISTAGIKAIDMNDWETSWFCLAYVKVKEGTDLLALQNKINSRHKEIYGICPNCPEGSYTKAYFQPVGEVPFSYLLGNTFSTKAKHLLISLEILAFVILLLGWINYGSLSIYQLKKRLPEIGTRRVVGAGEKDLIIQFLIDALVINTISFLIGLTLVQISTTTVEIWLSFYTIEWSKLPVSSIAIMIGMFTVGVIVTAIYPILISTGKPILHLLKKRIPDNAPAWNNPIVTIQYVSATVLLIWIVIVYFQLNLVLTKSAGIDKEGIVVIDCPLDQKGDFRTKLDNFMDRTLSIQGVLHSTISKSVVGDPAYYGIPLQRNKNDVEFGLDTNGGVDENYLETYGINLLHGRNFRHDMPSDRNSILLSKAAALRMGFAAPEDALGVVLVMPWYHYQNVEVIGIYQDYEFRPFLAGVFLKDRGSFLSYRDFLIPDFYPSKISVKLSLDHIHDSMLALEELYKKSFPQETFRWSFIDEKISQHYQSEKVARNQLTVFTLIAIGIACLGLLGMVSNRAIEKTKEIGIRKVLGAQLPDIAGVLLNNTTKQLIMAALMGIPLAYLFVSNYLEKFSERISLQWWYFVLPLLVLVLILFVTVSSVIWRAARKNPVDALKCE